MTKRMVILVSAALMATLGIVGCGNKSATTPIVEQDTAPPAAVTGFTFQLNATQSPNIVLSWNASAELDLAGYNVYRMLVLPANREMQHITAGMELIRTVTNSFVSDDAVVSGSTYVYAVSAFDVSGNESARVESTPLRVRVASRSDGDLRLN